MKEFTLIPDLKLLGEPLERMFWRSGAARKLIELVYLPQPRRCHMEVTKLDVALVDTGNYYPQQRDGAIDEIENGMAESRWVERQLGHPVIKAFNNIYAQHLLERGKPAGTEGRIALPVAGDDVQAKAVVMRLIDELGLIR